MTRLLTAPPLMCAEAFAMTSYRVRWNQFVEINGVGGFGSCCQLGIITVNDESTLIKIIQNLFVLRLESGGRCQLDLSQLFLHTAIRSECPQQSKAAGE